MWVPGSLGLGWVVLVAGRQDPPKSAWAPRPPRGVFKEDEPQEETAERGYRGWGECPLPGPCLSASVAQLLGNIRGRGREALAPGDPVGVSVPLGTRHVGRHSAQRRVPPGAKAAGRGTPEAGGGVVLMELSVLLPWCL